MPQGREALCDPLGVKAARPLVVVPFGIDPFGLHGDSKSYPITSLRGDGTFFVRQL